MCLVFAYAEPLFVDPYAGCFVPPNVQMDMKQCSQPYCLATKFIDDKLLRTVNHIDGVKQVFGGNQNNGKSSSFMSVKFNRLCSHIGRLFC